MCVFASCVRLPAARGIRRHARVASSLPGTLAPMQPRESVRPRWRSGSRNIAEQRTAARSNVMPSQRIAIALAASIAAIGTCASLPGPLRGTQQQLPGLIRLGEPKRANARLASLLKDADRRRADQPGARLIELSKLLQTTRPGAIVENRRTKVVLSQGMDSPVERHSVWYIDKGGAHPRGRSARRPMATRGIRSIFPRMWIFEDPGRGGDDRGCADRRRRPCRSYQGHAYLMRLRLRP